MRTIFVRVTNETTPSYRTGARHADHVDHLQHRKRSPDFADAALEFGTGDAVRCKVMRLRGPGESEARQRMIATCTPMHPTDAIEIDRLQSSDAIGGRSAGRRAPLRTAILVH